MKRLGALLFFLVLSSGLCVAQKPASPSTGYTDVYHVHFNKAAIGQASALADVLKTQDPKAPMPDENDEEEDD